MTKPTVWMYKRPEWTNWLYKEWTSDAFGEDADQYIKIALGPVEASAPGLSEDEIQAIEHAIQRLDFRRAPEKFLDRLRAIITRASAATVAEPSNAEGPEHLCPQPASGLEFDERGVLVKAAQQQAEPGALVVELRRRQAEAEEKRQTEENPNWERIYLGMRDAYDIAANLASKHVGQTCGDSPEHVGIQQAEPGADERSQQLAVFLRLAEVVQADSKKTHDRYPAQSERADQLAAFMKTACKWAAQSGQRAGVAEVRDELLSHIKTMCEGSIVKTGDDYALGAHNLAVTILRMLAAPTHSKGQNNG